MLACHDIAVSCASSRAAGRTASRRDDTLRVLEAGQILFHAGDERTRLYRVERGALCHYVIWGDGHHDVIEYAFAGDIVGLGHLDQHVSTAQAMTQTGLRLITKDELATDLRTDARLAMRLAAAADLEFEVAKSRAVQAGRGNPMSRVAAYLLVAANAGAKDQATTVIPSAEVASAWTAEALDLSIGALRDMLVSLERRGLVEETPAGIRLQNVAGLELIAANAA